jgi:arginase family enzyme
MRIPHRQFKRHRPDGVEGIIERLRRRVGKSEVYVSVDIDVSDPDFAPGKIR